MKVRNCSFPYVGAHKGQTEDDHVHAVRVWCAAEKNVLLSLIEILWNVFFYQNKSQIIPKITAKRKFCVQKSERSCPLLFGGMLRRIEGMTRRLNVKFGGRKWTFLTVLCSCRTRLHPGRQPLQQKESSCTPKIRHFASVVDPESDPDPYFFGPPGSRSISARYGSGSGSFYHQAKIVRKTIL
jgi:hypothetical protein